MVIESNAGHAIINIPTAVYDYLKRIGRNLQRLNDVLVLSSFRRLGLGLGLEFLLLVLKHHSIKL